MGCGPSATASRKQEATAKQEGSETAVLQPAKPPKPSPAPFAIMRNGHEVIRAGMLECSDALEKNDYDSFKQRYDELALWQRLHATMEDGDATTKGMWAFLDENESVETEKIGKKCIGAHHELQEVKQRWRRQLQLTTSSKSSQRLRPFATGMSSTWWRRRSC
jgi:hypothetical protein